VFLCALLVVVAIPALAARVVSLNLCTDDFLILLAPEQIAAVSPLARDPSLSVVAGPAARLPWVRADAEAVLALHPDLVLAGPYGARATLASLEQHGLRVERVPLPETFAEIREQTRHIGELLGEPARAAALLDGMNRVLAVVPHAPATAIALEARGWSAGPGSLADAVLRAAGLRDVGTGGQMSLETIAAHPPDLLVVSPPPAFPSLATEMSRHPALAAIPVRMIPPAMLACGGPWTAEAVALLAAP
jgi:iron complex transport system substrate-binding protein